MNGSSSLQKLSASILSLRKAHGLTQEELADKLSISFQAVSKWENGQSSPDIALLPVLAGIFGVTVDALFGRETAPPPANDPKSGSKACITELHTLLPWDNDGVFRGVVFRGREMLTAVEDMSKFSFTWDGAAADVECGCHINCGDIGNNASAGCDIHCGHIGNDANAGCDIFCGDIGNNAEAGCDINCGDIGNNASAGCDVSCGDVSNNANAGANLTCGDVGGDANAGSLLTCGDIGGNAGAGRNIICGEVGGVASAGV